MRGGSDGARGRGGGRERPSFADDGIVLRTHKLGESDKIVRVLTRGHGKRSAVAKGARKTTSRFGGRLEPLTLLELFLHRGRSMDTIQQTEIKTSFKEVREDLDLFLHASAMVELIDRITLEGEPHPELFDLLERGLTLLGSHPGRAPETLVFFEFRVLAAAGFELRVTGCASCGGETGAGEVSFSLHMGGLVCDRCRADARRETGKMIRVGGEAAGVLDWIAGHDLGEWPESEPGPAARRELRYLMDRVLEHWMEREFKTHRVMRRMPDGRASEGG